MVIYKITNTVNGRSYIGQTVGSVGRRWNQHSTSMKNSPLYNAFRKYGRDKFTIEVLCCVLSPEHLNELECYFINYYNTFSPNGYNLTTGGDCAYTRSEESREKQRAAMTGRSPSVQTRAKIAATLTGRESPKRGTTLTEEAKRKISEAQIGRAATQETKDKMRAAHKARLAANPHRTPAQVAALAAMHERNKGRKAWNKGTQTSEEVKKKLSEAHKGQVAWNKGLKKKPAGEG